MRTEEKTALIKKYFTPSPSKWPPFTKVLKIALCLIILGTIIAFVSSEISMIGVVLIAGGIIMYTIIWMPYFRKKRSYLGRPAIDDMYTWFINDLHTKIKEKASEVLRLNINSLKPENFMIIPHPVYWQEPGVKSELILKKETEDEKVIYSIWKVQIIALTQNYISYYCCTYDWLNNAILNERTNEFFYIDISSVKNDVEQISKTLIGETEPKTLNTFVFKVTNMSSDNLTVITKIPELNYSGKLEVSLEKAVQALRIILRKRRVNEDQEPKYIEPEI